MFSWAYCRCKPAYPYNRQDGKLDNIGRLRPDSIATEPGVLADRTPQSAQTHHNRINNINGINYIHVVYARNSLHDASRCYQYFHRDLLRGAVIGKATILCTDTTNTNYLHTG